MGHTFKELIYIDKNKDTLSNNKGIFQKNYLNRHKNYNKKSSFR